MRGRELGELDRSADLARTFAHAGFGEIARLIELVAETARARGGREKNSAIASERSDACECVAELRRTPDPKRECDDDRCDVRVVAVGRELDRSVDLAAPQGRFDACDACGTAR